MWLGKLATTCGGGDYRDDRRSNKITTFDYKMSIKILYVRIKYSMYHLIFDVISCCVLCCDMGKINVYDKTVMKKI